MIAMTRDTRPLKGDGFYMRCNEGTNMHVRTTLEGRVTIVAGPGNYATFDRQALRDFAIGLMEMIDGDDPTI